MQERIEIKSRAGINWKCATINFDDCYIHIYFQETPEKPELFTSNNKILQESKHQNWGKGIDTRFDRSNYGLKDPNKDHLHVYKKGSELFAINRDGTAHDRSHQFRIPNKIATRIKQEYPDFTIPSNNFIESIELNNNNESEEIVFLLEKQ